MSYTKLHSANDLLAWQGSVIAIVAVNGDPKPYPETAPSDTIIGKR